MSEDNIDEWTPPGYDDETLEQWGIESEVDLDELDRDEFVDLIADGTLQSREAAQGVQAVVNEDEVAALIADLETVASDADEERRIVIAHVLARLGQRHPERAAAASPLLIEMTASDSVPIRNYALTALAAVSAERPATVREVGPRLAEYFDSTYPNARRRAVEIAATLSQTYPAEIAPHVPELATALQPPRTEDSAAVIAERFATERTGRDSDDGESATETVDESVFPASVAEQFKLEREAGVGESVQNGIQQERAATAVSNVAAHDVDTVTPHVNTLFEALTDDTTTETRRAVLDALYAISRHDPEAVMAGIEPVSSQLSASSEGTRGAAARVLAVCGEENPEYVTDVVGNPDPLVVELLDADHAWVRGAGVNLLSYIAEVAPDRVRPAVEEIVELLDVEELFIRGGAVWCLRYLGGPVAREALRTTAESDPEEQVRRMADEALADLG